MKVKFSDVVVRANTKEDKDNTDRLYYVGGEHIDSGEIAVTKRGLIEGSTIGPMFYFGFKKGQMLFVSRNPHLKKAAMATFDGICSEKTFVLETKDEQVLSQMYLPIIMQSNDFWQYCESHKSGGVNFFVNWSTLANYEFSLPSLSEQRVLADKLWAAYRLKESYKKLIDATKDMVKAKFVEMTQTSPKVRIREVASISKVSIMPKAGSKYNLYSFPAFDNDRTPEYIDGSEIKSSKIVLPRECVLYNKLNVRLCRVWNIKLEKDNNNICSSEFLPFIPNGSISSAYFYRCLLSDSVTTAMTMASKGTSNSQKRITPKDILDFEIPLPNASIQKSFVALASQADLSLSTLRSVITSVDSVMKSLINN